MSEELIPCPKCECHYGYELRENHYACPECINEWDTSETEEEQGLIIKDSNGTILKDGDSAIVIKDLTVKGAPKPVKAGTKIKTSDFVTQSTILTTRLLGLAKWV